MIVFPLPIIHFFPWNQSRQASVQFAPGLLCAAEMTMVAGVPATASVSLVGATGGPWAPSYKLHTA